MNFFYYQDILGDDSVVGIPQIPPHLEHPKEATHWGQTYLWVTFAIMVVFSLLLLVALQRASYRCRLLHTNTFFIIATAALSYFAMASGVGKSYVFSGRANDQQLREFFYARDIGWAITTPLLLFNLTLLAGLPIAEMLVLIAVSEIMIITGMIASLHPIKQGKWGFFFFSCLAFIYIIYHLITSARNTAFLRGNKVGNFYLQVSWVLIVVWALYPITFSFGLGTNHLSIDSEILFFAILDVIAKPLWSTWLLLAIPEEGQVLIPETFCNPLGSSSSVLTGGYGTISQEPRAEEA